MTSRLKPIRNRPRRGCAASSRWRRRRPTATSRRSRCTLDGVHQRPPRRVRAPRCAAVRAPGPTAVAVHHQRDVIGNQLRRDRGRSGPRGMRRRRPDRSTPSGGAVRRITASSCTTGAWGRERSISGRVRNWRSRCHCRCAATRPLACLRCRRRWVLGILPVAAESASISSSTPGAGWPHRPGGSARTPLPRRRHGRPDRAGVAHRAHSSAAGAHPARPMARNRNASRIRSRALFAPATARSAPRQLVQLRAGARSSPAAARRSPAPRRPSCSGRSRRRCRRRTRRWCAPG